MFLADNWTLVCPSRPTSHVLCDSVRYNLPNETTPTGQEVLSNHPLRAIRAVDSQQAWPLPPPTSARDVLVVWQPRWCRTYGEVLQRLIALVGDLCAVAGPSAGADGGGVLTFHVPLPFPAPPFFEALLRPFGQLGGPGRLFPRAVVSCGGHKALQPETAQAAVTHMVDHYLGVDERRRLDALPAGVRPVVFIKRVGGLRRVANMASLLANCRKVFPCEEMDFAAKTTMPATVATLRRARALVGMHGSGIVNGVFLSAAGKDTVVVEIFPATFGRAQLERKAFGAQHAALFAAFRVDLRRLVAPEEPVDAACAKGSVLFRRDCNVTVDWRVLRRLLGPAGSRPSQALYYEA